MGNIAIEGMQFYSHHGYYKEEQILGGRYTVDVYLKTDFREAAANDALEKTVNYELIYSLTCEEMQSHAKLIEHVCMRILNRIIVSFAAVSWVKVRVSKHSPPLKGNVERVYVELEKSRQ